MTIIKVGLKEAEKLQGINPTGKKLYLVGSDTKISDDIDTILDASVLAGNGVPDYNDLWSIDTTVNLRVQTKRATSYDSDNGTQEGFWWLVDVSYEVPAISNGQAAEDPTDRDWLWSKGPEKTERALISSLIDTSDYVYPESDAAHMINRTVGDAITNTADEPPETSVVVVQSNTVISLSKYINQASDLGVASFEELDGFVDKINNGDEPILGITYPKWTLLMDSIEYEPASINGYDVIHVVFRIIVDTFKTHIFTYPSAGFNQLIAGDLHKIKNTKTGEDIASPKLLDDEGAVIPPPVSAPYISTPFLISVGRNEEADFSAITALPAVIP